MSVYFIKGKGWRFDFTLNGTRHTEAWFKTKKAARQAEAERKEECQKERVEVETPTDMAFFELVSRRLDYVQAYNSASHYRDYVCMARRWAQRWEDRTCGEITQKDMEEFVLERSKVSPDTANKEIRYLRATFNFGKKRKWILENPVDGLPFLPVEKTVRYVPPPEDIEKVLAVANPETRDYLLTIWETMGRMSEINRLTWDDVDFEGRYVVLYTRKKKGGHLTPRKVWMTDTLQEILTRRYAERDETKPWVFWHVYRCRKTGERREGPYRDRKSTMKTLCRKAGVRYFRFHPLRHSGASVMDNNNVPIGVIQSILGHENRATTEVYLHRIGQAERDAMAVYERARRNSHTESHTETKKDSSQSA